MRVRQTLPWEDIAIDLMGRTPRGRGSHNREVEPDHELSSSNIEQGSSTNRAYRKVHLDFSITLQNGISIDLIFRRSLDTVSTDSRQAERYRALIVGCVYVARYCDTALI
jgi:hypothetical protein